MSACNMYSNGKLIQTFHFRGDQTFYIDSFGNISFGKYRLCKTCHKFHKGICWYTPKGYKLLANKRKFMKKKIQIAKISCSKEQTVIYTPEKKQLENNLSLNSNRFNLHKTVNISSSSTFSLEKNRFLCPNCGKCYKHRSGILRHLKYECGVEPRFNCKLCWKKFARKEVLDGHMINIHKTLPYNVK
ncbi:gastrula zinc finger protein XlCGF66.1-like isoform X1 [Daktulosphaira vitifoliae]|uniref:gastrula zinc finger protein XlCGF66.1-like isoform X1 n=1 Tax=Daktulosphaira vitifoliae TaxID=58002 RepID=UPI0021AA379F|nr:gastrula zinc finger protein XlCGF66.1-like isoform X1 [Daktulosphaira vitifoliae]XP_050536194.1 gastrula zinc finger protein XlCGF66.1-like isoform X1 [Daktulosphaira vitifoliae]XP_050536195.1 gastrula zinc finger protein XlCGF66.1-like isoform X1 [Daktulosphaira vitifoliae]XP_050536197.1 gastrula zinc finger protein XlCGF66.1-like isoform X1 [Daktulosphaira vitifoliae]